MKSKHIGLLFRVHSNGWGGEGVGGSSPLIMMLITLRPLPPLTWATPLLHREKILLVHFMDINYLHLTL